MCFLSKHFSYNEADISGGKNQKNREIAAPFGGQGHIIPVFRDT